MQNRLQVQLSRRPCTGGAECSFWRRRCCLPSWGTQVGEEDTCGMDPGEDTCGMDPGEDTWGMDPGVSWFHAKPKALLKLPQSTEWRRLRAPDKQAWSEETKPGTGCAAPKRNMADADCWITHLLQPASPPSLLRRQSAPYLFPSPPCSWWGSEDTADIF